MRVMKVTRIIHLKGENTICCHPFVLSSYKQYGIYDEYQTEEKSYYRIAWIGDIVACHFDHMDQAGRYKCQYKELRIFFLLHPCHVIYSPPEHSTPSGSAFQTIKLKTDP